MAVKGGLFDNLKAKAPAKEAKKVDKHERIEVKSAELFENIKEYAEVGEQLAIYKSKSETLNAAIKEDAAARYAKLMEQRKGYPGTVVVAALSGQDIAQIQFIPTDKYLKVDSKKAEVLRDTYGDIVEEHDAIVIKNNDLFIKHQDVIAKALQKAGVDPMELFDMETTYAVKKGAVSDMVNIAKKAKKGVADVMSDLGVIVQLKAPNVIEK